MRTYGKLYCAGFATYKLLEMQLAKFRLIIKQSSFLYIIHHGGVMIIKEVIDKNMHQLHDRCMSGIPNAAEKAIGTTSPRESGIKEREDMPMKKRYLKKQALTVSGLWLSLE